MICKCLFHIFYKKVATTTRTCLLTISGSAVAHYFGTHVYGGDELELQLDGVQYFPKHTMNNVIAGIGVRFLMLTRFKTHICCGLF